MKGLRSQIAAGLVVLAWTPVDAGEVSDWQQARKLDSCEGYRAFLLRYPETRFATLIRKRTGSCPGGAKAGIGAEAGGVGGGVAEVVAAVSGTPGWTFEPEMVAISGGSFLMGSPAGEPERDSDEGPQHRVAVPAFELGRSEVTFAQWDACVSDGGCSHRPEDRGWDRGDRPVMNVSWDDAQGYVAWLNRKTAKAYRLPSEAEWEYAARAGTTTAYFWGNDKADACTYANGHDETSKRVNEFTWEHLPCDDGSAQTAKVGSYRPNPWGLSDVSGNVWEWTADCWNDGYTGAPGDGSAWERGECGRRVVRGGSLYFDPRGLRSAFRNGLDAGSRYGDLGFRVARTLIP